MFSIRTTYEKLWIKISSCLSSKIFFRHFKKKKKILRMKGNEQNVILSTKRILILSIAPCMRTYILARFYTSIKSPSIFTIVE